MKRSAPLIALGAVGLAIPVTLWALQDGHGPEQPEYARLFLVLAVMLVVGKFSGELTERMGQPAVLGELVAGALLGGSVLGLIPTGADDSLTPIIQILAEIGVVILLFEIGLETDLKAMARIGRGAVSIAVVGVILPMIGGILFWLSPLDLSQYSPRGVTMTAVFIGGTLTATSVGITARVLSDIRVMHSFESRFIIGAAVIDDVLGLVVLGIVSGLAAGQAVTLLGVSRSFGLALGFLIAAVGIGLWLAPKIFDVVNRMRVRGILLVIAFAFLLVVASLASVAGSALIVGAFAAGLVLSGTNQFDAIKERIQPVADIFTPIFFLRIGAEFDVGLLNPTVVENLPILGLGLALFVIAVAGKIIAGWAVPWRKFNRLAVGVGMVPRGEVGLIFANIGLATGVLSRPVFGAVIIMVIATTFIAPPLLKWSFSWGGVTDSFDEGPLRD
jgi:Kef-type K+ transport system membrane component KefB